MQYYIKLNKTGRKKALELMEDYASLKNISQQSSKMKR